jgi:hypothetical protein
MAIQLLFGPWPLFFFLVFRNPTHSWQASLYVEINPSQGRYLHTGQHKAQNKRTQTSMLRVGFENTPPVFKRAKTDHTTDRVDNVTGKQISLEVKLFLCSTNYALCHEGVWGSGCIDLHFLDLGTSWR